MGETAAAMFEKWAFPNTFLIYRGVEAKDFDLKLEIKVEKGGGSGIQIAAAWACRRERQSAQPQRGAIHAGR